MSMLPPKPNGNYALVFRKTRSDVFMPSGVAQIHGVEHSCSLVTAEVGGMEPLKIMRTIYISQSVLTEIFMLLVSLCLPSFF